MFFHQRRCGNKVVPLKCTKRNFWIISGQGSGKGHEEGHMHEYYWSKKGKSTQQRSFNHQLIHNLDQFIHM